MRREIWVVPQSQNSYWPLNFQNRCQHPSAGRTSLLSASLYLRPIAILRDDSFGGLMEKTQSGFTDPTEKPSESIPQAVNHGRHT